ncbi:MAG: hypothetical protein ABFD12_05380 [Syntrophorhabdus sp.]
MRTLNNNRGSLLVILVIAITLIAVLGAGFVSLVGSKHEGYTHLVAAQKANMAAKAGVEWAIRFASFGTDANSNSIFFSNPTLVFTKDLIPGVPAEGSFTTSYDYAGTGDALTVNGTYQGTTETITLTNFRRYLSCLTLIPDANQVPRYRPSNRRILEVPVLVNEAVAVSKIDITTGMSNVLLRYITYPNGAQVFDYESSGYATCSFFNPSPPCSWFGYGILLSSSTTRLEAPYLQQSLLGFMSGTYYFRFYDYAPASAPLHTIVFNPTGVKSQVAFRP